MMRSSGVLLLMLSIGLLATNGGKYRCIPGWAAIEDYIAAVKVANIEILKFER